MNMKRRITKHKIVTVLILFFLVCSALYSGKTACGITSQQPNNSKDIHYYSYTELTELLEELQQEYPTIFSYESLGKTHQNREIWLAKISNTVGINDSKKPAVLYSGGMHGNEKPGYQTVIETIISIVENYTSPKINESFTARVRDIVNTSELFFIPMINPDGCEADKRKNGRENNCIFGKSLFSGVDICRNFDYNWEDAGKHPFKYLYIPRTLEDIKFLIAHKNYHLFERSVVRYPLTDIGSPVRSGFYRGPYPFSEPESRAIKKTVENHSILIWLDYHIFGEEIRSPSALNYNYEYDSDTEKIYSIAENISNLNGYEIFEHPECFKQFGTAPDWAYTNHNILSFIIELCPSMKPSVIYNTETILNIFKDHFFVNLYVAERARDMVEKVNL